MGYLLDRGLYWGVDGLSEVALYLVRHGSTRLNKGRDGERLRGWLPVVLSREGHKEAEETARALGHDLGNASPTIITSDLPRAAQTAEIIQRRFPDAPVIPARALRPWNVGDFAGVHLDTAKQRALMRHYKEDTTPPGGEPYSTFERRWRPMFGLLRGLGRANDLIAVVHVRNFQALQHAPGERPDNLDLGPEPGEYVKYD